MNKQNKDVKIQKATGYKDTNQSILNTSQSNKKQKSDQVNLNKQL